MKKGIIILSILYFAGQLKAQDLTGSWMGTITVNDNKLHLVFNIKKKADTGYTATFDSPDQKALGMVCSKVMLKNDTLSIAIAAIGGSYKGVWNSKDSISGTYRQGGGSIVLNMKRITEAERNDLSKDPVRSQTPKPPYSYHSEEVEYNNADKSLHYGATFTRPNGNGKFPAVIIISGSGTQDRDGSISGHKSYWVLADYLTKHGIAVLRVDDRGAGKSSLGADINKKTTVDFSYDVETSLNYLETRTDVDKRHLGLIGHSEGGLIAPMVAVRRRDVSFIVLWGAPGVPGAQILTDQNVFAFRKQGVDTAALNAYTQLNLQMLGLFKSSATVEDLDQKALTVFDTWKKAQQPKILSDLGVSGNVTMNLLGNYNALYKASWVKFFITYDPQPMLSQVKCSVLAVNGEKDTQVLPGENLGAIKEALIKGGNKDFEIKALPGLNHLLQTATTGDVAEYRKTDETMSPEAMNIICSWIKLHTK